MDQPVRTSGVKSADAVIYARPCYYFGARLLADATNASSIVLYDNASAASGTEVDKLKAKATDVMAFVSEAPAPVYCVNGIYADVTGTGAEYIVYFCPA